MLKQFENLIEEAKEEEYSNPLAPASYPQYGTELDVKYCSFYLKTGACRFGDRCSRHHMKPPSSDTILLPAMFQHISLGEDFTNDLDTDSGLEHEESDTDKSFAEFFWDVFPEFQAVGQVTMFKVCCNHEPHLRGNVYVQYQEEREAVKAYAKFNGRFYASRQISCEFVKIEKWKSAICGQFHRMRCPKGKHCNFLHVFKNPGGLFMVHGSEVGPLRGGGGNLTSNGESAVRMLDNHPVVQAARNRAGCQPVVPMKPARQLPVPQSAHQCRRGPGAPVKGRFDQSPDTRSRQSSRRGSRFHDSSSSYNRSHSDRKSSSVERSGRRGDRGSCRSERPHRSSPKHKRSRSSRRSRSPGSDRRRR